MKRLASIIFLALVLAVSAVLSASAADVREIFKKESFGYEGTELPYRIYIPEGTGKAGEYPLVLFLHGAGERGIDNEAQLKNVLQVLFDREDGLMEQAVVIAPQCPEGEQWVDTPWENGNYSVADVPESNELEAAFALVSEVADKYSCDPSRIYVMGISMGGFGTWDLMMRHPGFFAAGIPICGGADPRMAEIFVKTPVFTFHGSGDETVPFAGTAEMVRAIEDLGSRVVNFISYKGEGHCIWDKAAAEEGLMEWFFSQRLEIKSLPSVPDSDSAIDGTTESGNVEAAVSDSESGSLPANGEADTSVARTAFPTAALLPVAVAVVICASTAIAVALRKKK